MTNLSKQSFDRVHSELNQWHEIIIRHCRFVLPFSKCARTDRRSDFSFIVDDIPDEDDEGGGGGRRWLVNGAIRFLWCIELIIDCVWFCCCCSSSSVMRRFKSFCSSLALVTVGLNGCRWSWSMSSSSSMSWSRLRESCSGTWVMPRFVERVYRPFEFGSLAFFAALRRKRFLCEIVFCSLSFFFFLLSQFFFKIEIDSQYLS